MLSQPSTTSTVDDAGFRRAALAPVPDLDPDSLDLDDTSRCPTGVECTGCATGAADTVLTVVTAATTAGVACVSLCPACLDRPAPALPDTAAVRGVVAHCCDHLGIGLSDATSAFDSGSTLPMPRLAEPSAATAGQAW